jgi:hypothetical protein
VKLLLELGADPSIQNSYQKLAVQLSQDKEVSDMLNRALPPQQESPPKNPKQPASTRTKNQNSDSNFLGSLRVVKLEPRMNSPNTPPAEAMPAQFRSPDPESDILKLSSIPVSSPVAMVTKPSVSLARCVLQAAMETSATMGSPAAKLTPMEKVFRWSIEIKSTSFDRLEKYVNNHPDVIHARYVGMITTIPKSFTLLHSAASCGNTKVVELLIKAGADVIATDCFGQTALHMAAQNGHLDAVLLLKEAVQQKIHANPVGVNAPVDLSGCTPLGSETRKLKLRMTEEKSKHFDLVREKLFEAGDHSIFPEIPEGLSLSLSLSPPPPSLSSFNGNGL